MVKPLELKGDRIGKRILNLFRAPYSLFLFCALFLWPGCGPKAPPRVEHKPAAPEARVTETGHSVQLGAFSVLPNAVRLTERLKGLEEDVYYFRHESGLYKVRLGDFPTRQEALNKVKGLVSRGIVDEYFIAGPEDYALARARIYGPYVLREEIVRTAESFIGLPYQWGGSSPDQGFDCSGLTMAAYQMNGLNIPRTSVEQFVQGRAVSRKRLEKGDLVFFAVDSGGKISHVGIYTGRNSFIHAPGAGKSIRVDSLSNGYYSERYVGARTYL
ncbi:MAG: NlpC/P60 family protein [Thermodesulfobacteriota bacterium]